MGCQLAEPASFAMNLPMLQQSLHWQNRLGGRRRINESSSTLFLRDGSCKNGANQHLPQWLGFIGSEPKPDNIRFGTIPNVIPSELGRAKDFSGFVEAVATKIEAPFVELLDQFEYQVTAIVADNYLVWVPGFGNRRNIPVASLFTMSASVFSILHHFHLLEKNGHFPVELSERGQEIVDYIPGLPPTRLANLPKISSKQDLHRALECLGEVSKAQYLLFTSVYELEAQVIDSLQAKFPFPVYAIGPAIPYFQSGLFEAKSLQRFIIGLICPLAGYGIASM
ncbi:hypothetical protein QYF36_012956 [Acer negundo]|nr:hypothetical protein QYF36_012956 [Acer negundo]